MTGVLRRSAVTLLAGLVAAGAMTTAYARWSARATGTGTATTGLARSVALSPGTTGTALYPGASAPFTLVATNPNPGPVRVARLALDPAQATAGIAVDGAHPACTTGGLTVATSDNGGLGWTVPGRGTLTISLAGALTADSSLVSACQGATFTVYLTAA